MKDVVIVGAARTAIGTFGGSLKDVHAADLGAIVIKEALKRAQVSPEWVEDVIVGCVGQVSESAFIARMAALRAGLPTHSNAYTVNRLCGSGLQAINSAAQAIRAGEAEIIVAAGTENMDQLPYYVRKARYGYTFGHSQLEDGLLTALTDPFGNYPMGMTAEIVSKRFNISREEQDQFAFESQMKAAAAIDQGKFRGEIVPVQIPQRKGEAIVFDTDEHPRRGTTLEKLAALRPAFQEGGTVTAGNSSGINDAAAAVVVMSADKAKKLGLRPLAYIREQAMAGVEPEIMGFAPAPAVKKLLKKSGLSLQDIDLLELNEAFASQAVAVIKDLEIDPFKVNVNGGAIALGHPIGATGCILTVKILAEMERRASKYGVVTMCIGGGQAVATLFERA
ncbi:acetyl-CoA C-acyltransferase [Paenibacillus naphthalenovorans]|uniref:thiolase family protein n=1 Tax=Paenibacillus naphthalenovorans TaxID=162209 RepID=UPI0010B46C1E|nr:acetyl-CoA C-acetyltransferase [Paenibacillus naphthalenovorans]GCL70398.1 acetyl-CoA C-acyltransferase [Paenibacillus naphthalenovorans]